MIRALIIEDEQPARDLIKYYLSVHSNITLLGEFPDGFSGLKAIHELKPDLVFLDVQMPKLTGFELLELMDETPHIIFTTAYDQFAIKAFELNAVDYLLKPYSQERFNQAIAKVMEKVQSKPADQSITKLVEHVAEKQEILDRVVVKTGSKIKIVRRFSLIKSIKF